MENEKILLASILVTAMFLSAKLIEKKIREKYNRKNGTDDETLAPPKSRHHLKTTFHDAIFAFISCLASISFVENFWPLLQTTFDGLANGKVMDFGPPKVFTGNPDF